MIMRNFSVIVNLKGKKEKVCVVRINIIKYCYCKKRKERRRKDFYYVIIENKLLLTRRSKIAVMLIQENYY